MPGKNLKQTTQKSEPVVVATPQKGGKKAPASKVESTPAPKVESTPAPKVEAAPQKGGKKATTKVEATTVPVKVEVTATATKGVKKAPVATAKTELKEGKKTTTPKAEKKPSKKVETDVEGEESERHVRSFKVKLPGKEEFEGRFTGLTPYQAANKALSKYFRETEKPIAKITFSICTCVFSKLIVLILYKDICFELYYAIPSTKIFFLFS